MRLDRQFCADVERSSRVEWLETNGIGGYASGTVSGVPTRRYHALLIAALRPPAARVATLIGMDEEFADRSGRRHALSAAAYPDVTHPQGYRHLDEFTPFPFPTWTYVLPDGSRIVKTVALVQGENTVVLRYRLVEGGGGELRLRPRLVWRGYHALQRANRWMEAGVLVRRGRVIFQPDPQTPPIHLSHTAHTVDRTGWWYYQNFLAREQERGLDDLEDHWSPCALVSDLTPAAPTAAMVVTLDPRRADGPVAADEHLEAERRRREELVASVAVDSSLPEETAGALRTWAVRAEDFLVRRGDGRPTILAGYPWFLDWGRDAMISVPGLTLARGRYNEARGVLATFAATCDRGMIANRFPDERETPDYNNVDGTLWFVEAVRRYAAARPDDPVIRDEWYPLLRTILDYHRQGTRYGIHVDADGLLYAGEKGVQLTWMDAKVGDWVVTPRHGKPVEVNALWYNALRTVEAIAQTSGDGPTADACGADADRARTAFRARFPNPHSGCLFDVVDGPDGDDPTVRPNQVFAVSLPYRTLDSRTERSIVEFVDYWLYTPFGLRSLAPNHPDYCAAYAGDVRARDGAYHQGTVWGWLWGAYLTAYGNAFGRDERYRRRLMEALRVLAANSDVIGLGGIAEIYDGRAPHAPRGCPWQAWSVAEVLRVAWEEGLIRLSATPGE